LKDPDPEVRKTGAFWVSHTAFLHGERWRDVFTNAPFTDALLPLLDDRPDIAEMALNALSTITRRYRKEERVYPKALQLLNCERYNARLVSAIVAMNLRGEECAEAVLKLFRDPDRRVRAMTIVEVRCRCESWSAAAKGQVRAAALQALTDRSEQVRDQAAWLLGTVVGQAEDRPAIEAALRRAKTTMTTVGAALWSLDQRLNIGPGCA
jgi:hypothetical protein